MNVRKNETDINSTPTGYRPDGGGRGNRRQEGRLRPSRDTRPLGPVHVRHEPQQVQQQQQLGRQQHRRRPQPRQPQERQPRRPQPATEGVLVAVRAALREQRDDVQRAAAGRQARHAHQVIDILSKVILKASALDMACVEYFQLMPFQILLSSRHTGHRLIAEKISNMRQKLNISLT